MTKVSQRHRFNRRAWTFLVSRWRRSIGKSSCRMVGVLCAHLKRLHCTQGGSSVTSVTHKATGIPLAMQNRYFLQDERALPISVLQRRTHLARGLSVHRVSRHTARGPQAPMRKLPSARTNNHIHAKRGSCGGCFHERTQSEPELVINRNGSHPLTI